jgi:hypothetical protein
MILAIEDSSNFEIHVCFCKETPEFLKAYLQEQAERESSLQAKEADAAKKVMTLYSFIKLSQF